MSYVQWMCTVLYLYVYISYDGREAECDNGKVRMSAYGMEAYHIVKGYILPYRDATDVVVAV